MDGKSMLEWIKQRFHASPVIALKPHQMSNIDMELKNMKIGRLYLKL